MRNRWTKLVLFTLLTGVVSVAATVAIVWQFHTVPLSQCSEVYRQYRNTPDVKSAFIQDVQINDTLQTDMTVFEATDSAAYVHLLSQFGRSGDAVSTFMLPKWNERTRFVGVVPRGNPGGEADSDDNRNEVMVILPVRRLVAFFHTRSAAQLDVILDGNLFKDINVQSIH